jgi:hypothetical protein
MISVRLCLAVLLVGACLVALSGCGQRQIEPSGIHIHADYSASGAAWRYREKRDAEKIITGAEGATLEGSLRTYQDIWRGLPGRGARIRLHEDNVSKVLVITLDRSALAKDNPLRGGINNWWYKELYPRLLATAESAQGGRTGNYKLSIHLASRTTERSLLYDAVSEAQLKLRHLSSWLMEDGFDPRMLTGQVIESEGHNRSAWELAIVIRPFSYGNEKSAETILPAWLY